MWSSGDCAQDFVLAFHHVVLGFVLRSSGLIAGIFNCLAIPTALFGFEQSHSIAGCPRIQHGSQTGLLCLWPPLSLE